MRSHEYMSYPRTQIFVVLYYREVYAWWPITTPCLRVLAKMCTSYLWPVTREIGIFFQLGASKAIGRRSVCLLVHCSNYYYCRSWIRQLIAGASWKRRDRARSSFEGQASDKKCQMFVSSSAALFVHRKKLFTYDWAHHVGRSIFEDPYQASWACFSADSGLATRAAAMNGGRNEQPRYSLDIHVLDWLTGENKSEDSDNH